MYYIVIAGGCNPVVKPIGGGDELTSPDISYCTLPACLSLLGTPAGSVQYMFHVVQLPSLPGPDMCDPRYATIAWVILSQVRARLSRRAV